MSKRVIAQPLPLDIRDWSFRGLDCQGWDFSGRDIRGCDFRNANLNGCNFTEAIAGRSEKQQTRDIIITNVLAVAFVLAIAFASAGPVAVAVTFASAFAFTGAFAVSIAVSVAFIGAVVVSVSVAVLLRTAIDAFARGQVLAGLVFSLLSLFMFVIAIYSTRAAVKEFKNGAGTDFSGAILTFVDFTDAVLNNCKFDNAETSNVNWKNVAGARSTIDFSKNLMELLISRKGTNGIYQDLNLSDLKLFEIDLMKANLTRADLTNSNFQKTDLRFANLSNTKAGGTDFSHAKLTGACIQNWTINSDTKFDSIECEHIYLTPDQKTEDRRPLSGTFEPGDFQLLVDKFADTLDFILRRGTDPVAFHQALSQFQRDNPEARIKAMVDLDPDRVLLQATVPDTTDKVQAFEQFQNNQATFQAAQGKIRYLEGVEEGRTRSHAENQEQISMMQLFFQPPKNDITVLVPISPTGDFDMSKIHAGRDSISAGANNSGVVGKDLRGIAGRDISGNLNITLSDLAATEDPKNKQLATLLDQIKKTIESPDCQLDDRYKKRALEYLDNLANLAKEQPENRIEQAKNNLEDLADVADKGSKIATFAEKCFPTFMVAIGALKLWFGLL